MCMLSCFSRVRLSVTPWTVPHQAPLSMGILQARILEWVAIFVSKIDFIEKETTKDRKGCVCVCVCVCVCTCTLMFSHVWLFVTPWTVGHQAPLSMKFSKQEYWWVAISYSRGSSWPRDQTYVSCLSCIGRQIPYHCTTWEALRKGYYLLINELINQEYIISLMSTYLSIQL